MLLRRSLPVVLLVIVTTSSVPPGCYLIRLVATDSDGNRFEDTVDAVVNAIRDAEARRAAETEPSGASA